MISATQQHGSASQPEASAQTQHPHYAKAANDFDVDKYITASDADVPDAWHIQPVSPTDQQHEWSGNVIVTQQWTDDLDSMPEEDCQHSSPLHGYVLHKVAVTAALLMLLCCSHMCFDCREEHGPHVWVGDLELATPTAAFGKPSNHLL